VGSVADPAERVIKKGPFPEQGRSQLDLKLPFLGIPVPVSFQGLLAGRNLDQVEKSQPALSHVPFWPDGTPLAKSDPVARKYS
jgi:hypothetical protein